MEELDNQRRQLQESSDEMTRITQLLSAKDATIKGLRASKKSIAQELEAAQLATRVAKETAVTFKAQRDKALDKAIRAGRILMRRPGVIVPEDIRADVNAAPILRIALLRQSFLRKTSENKETLRVLLARGLA
jgi:hypothetical protein